MQSAACLGSDADLQIGRVARGDGNLSGVDAWKSAELIFARPAADLLGGGGHEVPSDVSIGPEPFSSEEQQACAPVRSQRRCLARFKNWQVVYPDAVAIDGCVAIEKQEGSFVPARFDLHGSVGVDGHIGKDGLGRGVDRRCCSPARTDGQRDVAARQIDLGDLVGCCVLEVRVRLFNLVGESQPHLGKFERAGGRWVVGLWWHFLVGDPRARAHKRDVCWLFFEGCVPLSEPEPSKNTPRVGAREPLHQMTPG